MLGFDLNWVEILTVAYAAAGVVGVAGYIPQILALWRDNSRSLNVPLLTWSIWTAQTAVYFAYAMVVNGDRAFILIMMATLVAVSICLALLVYNRYFRQIVYNRRADDRRGDRNGGRTEK
ncbi:MAG: hypothetical protein EBQ80_01770 [Proteobacteria bacterium]|nr:hypothetical protein [Pseudomonadota bacterium]